MYEIHLQDQHDVWFQQEHRHDHHLDGLWVVRGQGLEGWLNRIEVLNGSKDLNQFTSMASSVPPAADRAFMAVSRAIKPPLGQTDGSPSMTPQQLLPATTPLRRFGFNPGLGDEVGRRGPAVDRQLIVSCGGSPNRVSSMRLIKEVSTDR